MSAALWSGGTLNKRHVQRASGEPPTRIARTSFVMTCEQEAFVNHSIYSADRMTHLKIVIVALVAATATAALGIASRVSSDDTVQARMIKAGTPVMLTSSTASVIR